METKGKWQVANGKQQVISKIDVRTQIIYSGFVLSDEYPFQFKNVETNLSATAQNKLILPKEGKNAIFAIFVNNPFVVAGKSVATFAKFAKLTN